jgi:Fe2+ or Zn2+ uptake regulation protein
MAVTDIDQRLIERLRKRDLRVTPQRLIIHRALCARPQHMTAEQVFESVSDVLPGTSLPTVYATLELLVDLGLITQVTTGSGANLFDSRVQPHAHTVCRRCGAIADLDDASASEQAVAKASEAGFVPEHAQLVVWGLCGRCAAGD